jgi:hypothetical protein
MKLDLVCPHCGAEMSGDLSPGEFVQCPACGRTFAAPSPPVALVKPPRRRWIIPAALAAVILVPILLAVVAGLRAPRPAPPVQPIPRTPRATSSSPSNPKPSAPKRVDRWRVLVNRDPVTDKILTTMIGLGEPVRVGALERIPAVALRREDGKPAAFAFSGAGLTFSTFGEDVTIRLDKAEAETSKWSPATDGEALFYPGDESELFDRLFLADQLVVRTQTIIGHTVTAQFDLSGMRAAWGAFSNDKPYDNR